MKWEKRSESLSVSYAGDMRHFVFKSAMDGKWLSETVYYNEVDSDGHYKVDVNRHETITEARKFVAKKFK